MKKLFLIVVFIIIVLGCINKIYASDSIDLCVVYEKDKYEKNDVLCLSFDLPKFSNLFEVIIRLEYDKNVLEPIVVNNEYYELNNHSIFDKFVVNKKINDHTIYAELMKNDIDDGYYSSYKNNMCIIRFNVLSHIDNVENCFSGDNIQVFLFDVDHKLIDYNLLFIKQIDAGFYKDSYDVNVFGTDINLEEIFYVNNRNKNEYLLLEEKKIDLNKIGSQIMQIGVFDLITGKYISYSTIINIIDNDPPIVSSDRKYNILDKELIDINFIDYISVSDNYDKNVNIFVNYYNKEKEKINDNIIDVFKQDFVIYVGYVAVDSSQNESKEVVVEFNLIDTTSPTIDISDINIIDNEIEDFEVMHYIDIIDELDLNPNVILTYYDSNMNIIEDYKNYLTINNCCYIEVYGIDKFNNISEKYTIKLSLIDTTSPIITYSDEVFIDDVSLDDTNYLDLINVNDNDERKCNISYDLFIDDILVDVENFKEQLLSGKKGYIKYYVYDYSLNYSAARIIINIKDTCSPEISVNVDDGEIYKELNEIKYEVKDNLSGVFEVVVLLDGQEYLGEIVSEGTHNLYITAKDNAGNCSEINFSFVVSNKSFIGNLIDGNIKIKSSIIVCVVILSTLIIGIIKFKYSYHLKKKFKES